MSGKPKNLLDLLREHDAVDWNAVSRRVKSHPREVASLRTPNRENCLFVAISRDAPSDIVRDMVGACPKSAREANPHTGLTALHVAVSKNYPPETTRMIVEAWPGAAARRSKLSGGSVPLHSVRNLETAKILVDACPSALHSTNNAGYLPLHRVTYANDVPVVVVRYLISEGERHKVGGWDGAGGALVATHNSGLTPLSAAIDMIDKGAQVNEFQSEDNNSLLSRAASTKWEKLIVIATAAKRVGDYALIRPKYSCFFRNSFRSDAETPVLHTVVSMDCPESIVSYALKLKPEQCQEVDIFGNTALHLACSNPNANEDILRMLLQPPYGYKDQAKMLDFHGSLPLHCYVSRGPGRCDSRMKLIIDAEPRALEAMDGEGLYPFMLAATSASDRAGGSKGCDLDTVYALLRETPWLVSRCVEIGHSQGKRSRTICWRLSKMLESRSLGDVTRIVIGLGIYMLFHPYAGDSIAEWLSLLFLGNTAVELSRDDSCKA
mmetsp:Transcript_3677/g.7141  ORF Transcript_3677/g.7141 Transcript_3677/m.7141 type:complete len:493 (+) Transcript_3677:169-1647(+)